MTAQEIVKYRTQSTSDQATTMHEAMNLMPDYGKDDLGIACLMAAAYNAGRAEAEAIPDNGGALGFYLQEIVNTAKQITDAGMLKRIYLLARRLLGKQPQPAEQPTKQISRRALDMGNLLRYAVGLSDQHLHLTTVVARTYTSIEYEAGQKPTEPESWLDKACALLPELTPEDHEVIYWRIDTMLVRRAAKAPQTPQAEAVEDTMFTLKALVNHEMADVTKPKTLDGILSYVRIAKQRE